MASKFKLKITTPVGTFTRTSTRPFTHVVVRNSPRAHEAFEFIRGGGKTGLMTSKRWHKDLGYAVTWHGNEQAARNAAAAPYMWDGSTDVVGIFAVEA